MKRLLTDGQEGAKIFWLERFEESRSEFPEGFLNPGSEEQDIHSVSTHGVRREASLLFASLEKVLNDGFQSREKIA